ncbi:MAG: hypothetical protein V4850_16485 [Myxococcota bacterium]
MLVLSLTACRPSEPAFDVASGREDSPNVGVVPRAPRPDHGGAPDDPRARLYAELRDKTERREAFSPPKEERLGLHVLAEMDAASSDLLAAESDVDLYYALVKLSAARRDRHLRVVPARGGLEVPGFGAELEAPLRFAVDYGTEGAYGMFVTDLDASRFDRSERVPEPGDHVVAVNGRPLADHVADLAAYHSWSTVENLWWNVADDLHERNTAIPPDRFSDEVTFALRTAEGAGYEVTVPYLEEEDIDWSGGDEPAYPDMGLVASTETYDLYSHTAGREVLLLQWHGFGSTLEDDIDRLVAYAEEEGLLRHALIVDATGSRGGSHGAYALRRLTGRPFTCTFGNLRLSDITPAFIEEVREGASGGEVSDADARLLEWLEGPVTDALLAGEPYSENVPFKLVDLPAGSDGMVEPAAVHFDGPLVALFGPGGGSHLDQFAAMIVDNDLGHTIGMSTGGYSNTWEWTETVTMPGTERPLVDFMWSIGQTIRPNGAVLEGNPAAVDEHVPRTAENWATYHADLLERAYAYLDRLAEPSG